MKETEKDDCVSVQDFPFDAWVEAMVFDMLSRLDKFSSAGLCERQAAVSLLNNMCLWRTRSGNEWVKIGMKTDLHAENSLEKSTDTKAELVKRIAAAIEDCACADDIVLKEPVEAVCCVSQEICFENGVHDEFQFQ